MDIIYKKTVYTIVFKNNDQITDTKEFNVLCNIISNNKILSYGVANTLSKDAFVRASTKKAAFKKALFNSKLNKDVIQDLWEKYNINFDIEQKVKDTNNDATTSN